MQRALHNFRTVLYTGLLLLACAAAARAERVKDLASVQGVRSN